ncbi:PLP-dependent aminotransferase family protein [Acidisoma cellulosilytica]|uniref:PLP-dependent aminotransferase family protein n=1 Tax=Acidisoma cellulosilyticum TaxID=2802395 RepID=A0A963Z1F6_9PROT|nr:PLP-dependent aminotransferase family protein [Acidisoma cellulosilyticum]MCB8881107.1 PLP-dependent aminotransferase family protein [Acidisoma cellulosilyticum]
MPRHENDLGASRTQRLVATLARMLEAGAPKPGERLPSVRQAAETHGVSKNTMAEVYDRLVASGHLEARRGAGYFARTHPAKSPRWEAPHVSQAIDLVSLLREQLDQHYAVRPGDGRPPASWMEKSELGAHFRAVRDGQSGSVEFGYGSSWGYLPLRERISLMLEERSIQSGLDQLLLTHGANHALDLIIRRFVEPGDVVFVDSPGYYPLFGKLKLAKAQIIGITRRPDGPDLDELAAQLKDHQPRLFFTQSLAHNPTGGSMGMHVAHSLLRAAETHDFQIVEDDAFADILPPLLPRLAAFDQLRRVIYVGTFAKTLSASLRVGYIAGDRETVSALSDIKLVTTVATSDFAERRVYDLIAGGHYLRHLRRLRQRVKDATAEALQQLRETPLVFPQTSYGGFYLWAELPHNADELALCARAANEGIFLAPGCVFRPDRSTTNPALRLNVAHANDPRFLEFLRQAL